MRAIKEKWDQSSCLNRALPEEMTFTLLGRDLTCPRTIRFWISERIKEGLNQPGDAQMVEAEECARVAEQERGEIRRKLKGAP